MRPFILCAGLWAVLSGAALAAEPPPETSAADRAEFGRAQLGGAGLSRVRSATLLPRTLSVSAHGGYFRQAGFTLEGGVDEHHLALAGVTFTPRSWLEVSATSRSVTHEQPAAGVRWAYLVNDILLRAKVGLPPRTGALSLAAEGVLRIPPPVGRSIPLWEGLSPGFGGLLTYDFRTHGLPLRLHLNSGLFIDDSVDFDDDTRSPARRFALFISTYNQWQSGAAVEARFQAGEVHVIPFLESTLEVALGGPGGPGASPMRLVPGLRVLPWKGVVLDASVELGIRRGSVEGMLPAPPYLAMLAIGYQGSIESPRQPAERVVERTIAVPAPPTTGQLKGWIHEEESRQPVADAIITLPGQRLLADGSGVFVTPPLPAGPLTVRAEREGYAPAEAQITVEPGQELPLELSLRKLPPPPPPLVTLRGTIVGEKGKAADATVGAPGAGIAPRAAPSGEYEFQVPAGPVTLEASAPGYLRQGRRIEARPGESVVVDFVLTPVPKKVLVVLGQKKLEIKKQVHFATNRDVILPDSAPLLDQVAAVLLDNPRLRLVRIEGHTDTQGEDGYNLSLSGRRAHSVMRALVERGVDAARLKAVGYGETRPIATNKTAAGRAKNRRVEFMIEEQDGVLAEGPP